MKLIYTALLKSTCYVCECAGMHVFYIFFVMPKCIPMPTFACEYFIVHAHMCTCMHVHEYLDRYMHVCKYVCMQVQEHLYAFLSAIFPESYILELIQRLYEKPFQRGSGHSLWLLLLIAVAFQGCIV